MAWAWDDPWAPVRQSFLPPVPGALEAPSYGDGLLGKPYRVKSKLPFPARMQQPGPGMELVSDEDTLGAMSAYTSSMPQRAQASPPPATGGGLLDQIRTGFGDRDIHGGTTAGGLLGSSAGTPPPPGGATAPAASRPAGAGLLSGVGQGIKDAWNGAREWMNDPAFGPNSSMSRAQVGGQALTALGAGILSARGAKGYGDGAGNAIGQGLIGMNQTIEGMRDKDQANQYKQMASMLQAAKIRAAQAGADKPEKVGPGDRLVDPTTGREIYAAPDKGVAIGEGQQLRDPMTGELRGAAVPKTEVVNGQVMRVGPDGAQTVATAQSQDAQNAAYASMTPDQRQKYAQGLINKLNEGPMKLSMQANPSYIAAQAETENSKKIGELSGIAYAKKMEAGEQASAALGTIGTMRTMLDKVPTGPGEGATDWARKAAVASGIADDKTAANLSGRQAFDALHNRLVKDSLGSLGAGVSNADLGFINNMFPNGDLTKEANQAILDVQEATANRQKDVAAFAAKWQSRPGRNLYGLDEQGRTFDQALAAEVGNRPLLSEQKKKELMGKLGYGERTLAPGQNLYDGLQ